MSESPTQNRRPPKSTRRSARQAAAQRRAQRQRMLTWGGIALAAAIVLAAVLIFVNRDDSSDDGGGEAVAWNEIPSDGTVLGDADAPVEFVVYSDYQCPFCKQFDDEDLPKVIENFVTDGEVSVEWRPMPIISQEPLDSPDNESVQASEAAMCAADQDQFWPYSEALFAAQGAENAGVYSDEMLKQTAADVGLDTAAFEECLDSGAMEEQVLQLRQEGVDSGIQGTPTFLINDQLVSYTLEGYDRLEGQLQDALDGNRVEG
jgi:protein-disulfide isomerase